MEKIGRLLIGAFVLLDICIVFWLLLHAAYIPVLHPAGTIAEKEKNLIILVTVLMLIVVVPVFALTAYIAYTYRESNTKASYTPDWDHNRILESLWWGIPCAIIFILSVIAWQSSHELDPYRPIPSSTPSLTIDVIALDWKWLFIYPKQHIASVNLIVLPLNAPVNFNITSDTVMNSFWIPSLAGQIYAMPGMSTQLHVMATRPGNFYGSPANISGVGFSRSTFSVHAVKKSDFNQWIHTAQTASRVLNRQTYTQLSKPSEDVPVMYYSSIDENLYTTIINTYMMPGNQSSSK